MTRKDYILIADAIKENMLYKPTNKNDVKDVDYKGLISSLCWRLKSDNSSFNSQRFKEYITPNTRER